MMESKIMNRLDQLAETLRRVKAATDYLAGSVHDIQGEVGLTFTIKCTASLLPEPGVGPSPTPEYPATAPGPASRREDGSVKYDKHRPSPLQMPGSEHVGTQPSDQCSHCFGTQHTDWSEKSGTENIGTQCSGWSGAQCMENIGTQFPSPCILPEGQEPLGVGTQFPSEQCLTDCLDKLSFYPSEMAKTSELNRQQSKPDDNVARVAPDRDAGSDKALCRVRPQKMFKTEVNIPASLQNEIDEIKRSSIHLDLKKLAGLPHQTEVATNTKSHPTIISSHDRKTPALDMLREQGCIPQLGKLLELQRMAMWLQHSNADTAISTTITAVNNLAVNEKNNNEMEACVPTLVEISLDGDTGEAVCLSSLQALTNLSVTSEHHGQYTRLVLRLYHFLSTDNTSIRLQALKILINLSCNPDMVPHLLAAKAPTDWLDLLNPARTDEAVILRFVTLLSNILSVVKTRQLTSSSLPSADKAASPETMYSELLGLSNVGNFKNKVFLLSKHENDDIKSQAAKVYGLLK